MRACLVLMLVVPAAACGVSETGNPIGDIGDMDAMVIPDGPIETGPPVLEPTKLEPGASPLDGAWILFGKPGSVATADGSPIESGTVRVISLDELGVPDEGTVEDDGSFEVEVSPKSFGQFRIQATVNDVRALPVDMRFESSAAKLIVHPLADCLDIDGAPDLDLGEVAASTTKHVTIDNHCETSVELDAPVVRSPDSNGNKVSAELSGSEVIAAGATSGFDITMVPGSYLYDDVVFVTLKTPEGRIPVTIHFEVP